MKKWNGIVNTAIHTIGKMKNHPSFKTMIFVLIVIFLVFLNVFQGITLIQDRYHMNVLKEELQQAENKRDVLAEEIETYKTNQYVEDKAKNSLGMVKSGETPVKVIEEKPKQEKEAGYIEPKEKISIYMQEWYLKLEDWLKGLKNT